MGSGQRAYRQAQAQILAQDVGYLEELRAQAAREDVSGVFLEQQEKISSLQSLLDRQDVSFGVPKAMPVKSQPNFLMLAGIGILLMLLLKKKGKG